MVLKIQDRGKRLIEDHIVAARGKDDLVHRSTALVPLITEPGVITGAMLHHKGKAHRVVTGAIVLAAGGFEANLRIRSQYLGPGWDLAKVRGSPYNTGDCL